MTREKAIEILDKRIKAIEEIKAFCKIMRDDEEKQLSEYEITFCSSAPLIGDDVIHVYAVDDFKAFSKALGIPCDCVTMHGEYLRFSFPYKSFEVICLEYCKWGMDLCRQ